MERGRERSGGGDLRQRRGEYGNDVSAGANDITLAELDGSTFEHVRVTSVSNPPATEFPGGTNAYSVFLGDYSGLAVSGSIAYPIWSDTRNQEFFQCPSASNSLLLCRVTNGNVLGFDEDVFTTQGLSLP